MNVRRENLDRHEQVLFSGQVGNPVAIWFDDPDAGDVPWLPCAIVQNVVDGQTVYVILEEEASGHPRNLEVYAICTELGAAYLYVYELRPWNVTPTWGHNPSPTERARWFQEYSPPWSPRLKAVTKYHRFYKRQ